MASQFEQQWFRRDLRHPLMSRKQNRDYQITIYHKDKHQTIRHQATINGIQGSTVLGPLTHKKSIACQIWFQHSHVYVYGREILLLFAIGFAVNLSNPYCQTVHFLEVEYGQKTSLRRIQFPTTSCTTFQKVKLAFDQMHFPLGDFKK